MLVLLGILIVAALVLGIGGALEFSLWFLLFLAVAVVLIVVGVKKLMAVRALADLPRDED